MSRIPISPLDRVFRPSDVSNATASSPEPDPDSKDVIDIILGNATDGYGFLTSGNDSNPTMYDLPGALHLKSTQDPDLGSQQAVTKWPEFWIYGVFLLFFALMGLIANILIVFVMSKRQMRSSVNTLIIGLAIFNLVLLVTCLLLFTPVPYCTGLQLTAACDFISLPIFLIYPISLISYVGSTWTCLFLALDRYLVLCHPTKAKSFCTVTNSIKIVVGIAVFSIIFNLPSFFEHYPSKSGVVTNLAKCGIYQKVYVTYLWFILAVLIPILSMVVLIALCINKMMSTPTGRPQVASRERKERHMAVLVITVLISYFVLNLLAFIFHFRQGFDKNWKSQQSKNNGTTAALANLFVVLNAAGSIVIYMVLNRRFRQIMLKVLLPCVYNPRKSYRDLSSRRLFGAPEHRESYGIVSMRRMPSGSRNYNRAQVQKTVEKYDGNKDTLVFDFSALNNVNRIEVSQPRDSRIL